MFRFLSIFLEFLLIGIPTISPFLHPLGLFLLRVFIGGFPPSYLDKMCKKANAGELLDLVKRLLIRCSNSL